MLNNEVVKLLNEQINKEIYSAYLYLDMANYYADKGLDGFENWFIIQAKEEMDHAMLIRTYLLNNNVKVKLDAIAAPDIEFADDKKPLTEALAHEEFVTASINNIYSAAVNVKEYRTMQFLDWFIEEQGEEEKNATDLITRYELFAQDSKGLYMMNQEMATRVHTPPSLQL